MKDNSQSTLASIFTGKQIENAERYVFVCVHLCTVSNVTVSCYSDVLSAAVIGARPGGVGRSHSNFQWMTDNTELQSEAQLTSCLPDGVCWLTV